MNSSPTFTGLHRFRRLLGVGLLGLFALVMGMALVPQWHHGLHKDADQADHEYRCVVAWLVQGGCDSSDSVTLVPSYAPPLLPVVFVEVENLTSLSVFRSLLEHAPPVV